MQMCETGQANLQPLSIRGCTDKKNQEKENKKKMRGSFQANLESRCTPPRKKTGKRRKKQKNVMIFSGQFGISLNQRRRRAPSVFLPTAVSPMNLIAHFSILFLFSFFSQVFFLSYLISPMNLIAHFSILFLSRIFTNFWF